jgi:hypothetical protein
VRLRPDPDRAHFGRVNSGACHCIPRGFNGHGDYIFIEAGYGFLFNGQAAAFTARPYAGDFFGG